MNARQIQPSGAAILAIAACLAHPPRAHAACECPSGSQWLAVGQSTKPDSCGLTVLLRDVETTLLHGDRYAIYVKSNMINPQPAEGQPKRFVIRQNHSITIPAAGCGFLLIGAHRAPQKDFVEFTWSYYD